MRSTWRIPIALLFGSMVAAAVVLAQSDEPQGGPPPPPPMRAIPGLTAEDPHPHACVDCHIVMKEPKEMDTRISTLMAQWNEGQVEPALLEKAKAAAADPAKITGKHPKVTGALKDIPKGCLMCHGKDSKTAPPFARMIHLVHLTGAEQNPYLSYFQGDCTHCHKLDQKTGAWSMPSASEP
jgi:hypothetical protein